MRPLVNTLLILAALAAAPAGAASPTVTAVLFYSPTCPHCHRVMTEVLPPLQARFGEGLRLSFLDVSGPQGGAMFRAAIDRYRIPPDKQGVPTLVAGDVVLTGDEEIPARLPALLERLLAAGGAPAPDFVPQARSVAPPSLAPPSAAPAPAPPSTDPRLASRSAYPHLPAGPASVAILGALLLALLAQLAHAGLTWRRRPPAGGAARRWALLALVLASLGVALYLAHAEVYGRHVICLSDCDVVHSSEWAWIFGVVPVGAVGAAGALGLLAAWLAAGHRDERVAAWAEVALLAMALLGVAFSAYLTFLELFVIGALCEWCAANAVAMALIAWLQLAPGKRALDLALRRGGAATMMRA